MTTKSTPAKATPGPSVDDLQTRIADLMDINDQLLGAIAEWRDITETQLMTFAANGYAPAAKALLAMRNARNAALESIVTKGVE